MDDTSDIERDKAHTPSSETPLSKRTEPTSKARSGLGRTSKTQQKERWESLQSHLDQALNQWNELSEQMQDELSPDQKRLQEVKQLLNQLKVKLDEF